MQPEFLVAVLIVAALATYLVLGGADYGGGIWDLLSCGSGAALQKETVARAIAPVWEANHVWLILVIVLLWTGFPPAFAAITTALHIPLLVLLLGIVCRGMSFTFRTYQPQSAEAQRVWGLVFSIASVGTPFFLGVIVGAITVGRVVITGGQSVNGYLAPWLAPFPFVVGGFTVALAAYLASTFLTVEAWDDEVREDFRKRSLIAGVTVAGFALLTLLVSTFQVPFFEGALLRWPWGWIEAALTAIAAVIAFWSTFCRRFLLARIVVAVEASLFLLGWAMAQYPYLVRPGLNLENSAAPGIVERDLVLACVVGSFALIPSIFYLFWVFKRTEGLNPDRQE